MAMDAQMQRQLDAIGTRYIRRAVLQHRDAEALVERMREGDYHCLADLDHVTHQLHGSAAMFEFRAVSERAGAINKLLKSFALDPAQWDFDRLDELMHGLGSALKEAAAARSRRAADRLPDWPEPDRTHPE